MKKIHQSLFNKEIYHYSAAWCVIEHSDDTEMSMLEMVLWNCPDSKFVKFSLGLLTER